MANASDLRTLTGPLSPLLTSEHAGEYLHLNPRTLANMRVSGRGPRFVRAGRRAFYRVSDLDKWIDARVFDHTAAERIASQPDGAKGHSGRAGR